MSKQLKTIVISTAAAAAVGYVLGVLTAPKSGKETRQDIKDAAIHGKQAAEKALKQLHTELASYVDIAKVKLARLQGKAKDTLEVAVAEATRTKEKVREALTAAHDGEATDKDLQRAIDEAERAVASLRNFLQK